MKPDSEALQAIEVAIKIEQDGLAFYTAAAEQTDDPNGKKMFQSLARDEAAHQQVFQAARESLLQGGDWLSPQQVAAISPGAFPRPPVFPTGADIQAAEIPHRQLDALKRGIEAEEASIAFYTEQMNKAQDPQARDMYAYLIEQEKGHLVILEGEYNYLNGTGFWFDFQEFGLEGVG